MRSTGSRFVPFASLLALAPALLPLAVGALVAGCAESFVEIKMDQPAAEKLKTEIPIYTQEQLRGSNYKVVLPLKATSCKHLLWDPPITTEDATAQLRFQARTARANGIMSVTCSDKEGFSLTKNCWESITCNAIAIQVSQ